MERKELNCYHLWMTLGSSSDQVFVSTQKPLELTNEFNKIAGYKLNIQKSVAFLYTNNEMPEREGKETIPFKTVREFPGGLVVRILGFHCRSVPSWGTEILQVV